MIGLCVRSITSCCWGEQIGWAGMEAPCREAVAGELCTEDTPAHPHPHKSPAGQRPKPSCCCCGCSGKKLKLRAGKLLCGSHTAWEGLEPSASAPEPTLLPPHPRSNVPVPWPPWLCNTLLGESPLISLTSCHTPPASLSAIPLKPIWTAASVHAASLLLYVGKLRPSVTWYQ